MYGSGNQWGGRERERSENEFGGWISYNYDNNPKDGDEAIIDHVEGLVRTRELECVRVTVSLRERERGVQSRLLVSSSLSLHSLPPPLFSLPLPLSLSLLWVSGNGDLRRAGEGDKFGIRNTNLFYKILFERSRERERWRNGGEKL